MAEIADFLGFWAPSDGAGRSTENTGEHLSDFLSLLLRDANEQICNAKVH
jgi:hypothetical protein